MVKVLWTEESKEAIEAISLKSIIFFFVTLSVVSESAVLPTSFLFGRNTIKAEPLSARDKVTFVIPFSSL